jgi:hypothetical protein
MLKGIRTVDSDSNKDGEYTRVRLVFGPHYFVEIHADESDRVTFIVGATHHGFKADASEVGGELERLINEVGESHPEKAID